jgi:DNA-binding transcriptional LysR family regulator
MDEVRLGGFMGRMLDLAGPMNQSNRADSHSHLECMLGPMDSATPPAGGELAAFVAAMEAGSIQGAADALQLTQSAVTKRVQNLERRVGGPLLDRGRFGVRPTAMGGALYVPAKRALEALQGVADAVERSRTNSAMDLRLSASLTIGEFLLPGWLAEFRVTRSDVHPQLEVINSHGVLDAVREDRSQIGFVEGLEPLRGVDAITVATDRLLIVVAAGHPWARRRAIPARELLSEPYLTRETASGTRAVAAAALARAGLQLTPAMQAGSLQSLKRALSGGGFTLISELTIEAEHRAGTLVGIPVRDVDLSRELRAVRRRRPALTGAARMFWRWLLDRS